MDDPRPEAPEFELTATATAEDGLQLGPIDLPDQPPLAGDPFAMKRGEAARVESYIPAKPAKKVSAEANRSVIAALMGLPIAKPKPAEPPAPELVMQSAIINALTAIASPSVVATRPTSTVVEEPPAEPRPEPVAEEIAIEPTDDQVFLFDAGVEVIHAENLPVIEDPAITEDAFDMMAATVATPIEPLPTPAEPTGSARGTGFQPVSSIAEEQHGLETRATKIIAAAPALTIVPIVAAPRTTTQIEVKPAAARQSLFARQPLAEKSATPPAPAAPARLTEPPRRAVPVAPVWPTTPVAPAAVAPTIFAPANRAERPRSPEPVAAPSPTLDYAAAETTSGSTGAWWTIPLTFVGIAIVACAVLIPAADENRRDNYELAKIEQDVSYFEHQSDVNQDFLHRVNTDATLAERLALRQLHQTRQGVKIAPITARPDPFGSSPYAMTRLDPPAPLPAYQPVPGKLTEWFLGGKNPQQMASLGLIVAGAGVLLGGLRFRRVRPLLPTASAA